MPLLTREQFVVICTQAISKTREKVTIRNQLSGYKKYHQEIKENAYFSQNVRTPLKKTDEDEYMARHALIGHVGLGNCHELADFLLVEIAREIDKQGACARIRIVESLKYDHVYLEIKIQLNDERTSSYWEVDAWDPRIIDISTRPNGSIKNHESLTYGYSTDTLHSTYSDEINYQNKCTFFSQIPKPQRGRPLKEATPEREMLDKHDGLYDDFTLEDAIETGSFDPSGRIHYLQKVSNWQRK